MTIRLTWLRAALALAAAAMLGLALAWSGIITVAASSGHWKITDILLHWVMRSSVRTHAAFTVDAPAQDASGLVSAAGHFAGNCAICHGAPGERPSPVMQGATPPAPDLADKVGGYSDTQLFWIVKHGVKYTGMPAWPTLDRDDEIRHMTAFIRRLPGMTPATYRALAYGPAAPRPAGLSRTVADALPECERCHGADGIGRGPDIPVLGGQKPAYLAAALDAYADRRRASGVMQAAVFALDPATRQALATHFAAMPGLPPALPAGSGEAARIVERGRPDLGLPACATCHGAGRNALYPLLAGQKASYIAARLRHWRAEKGIEARKDGATMPTIARRLPEAMIDPVARYLADER